MKEMGKEIEREGIKNERRKNCLEIKYFNEKKERKIRIQVF